MSQPVRRDGGKYVVALAVLAMLLAAGVLLVVVLQW